MNAAPARTYDPQVKGSSIENLWVILVPEDPAAGTAASNAATINGKTPMLARAGNGLYLLAFRTGFTARKFMTEGHLPGTSEPRMVVGSILQQIVGAVADKEISGVLVDYDFTTNTYREAGLMF